MRYMRAMRIRGDPRQGAAVMLGAAMLLGGATMARAQSAPMQPTVIYVANQTASLSGVVIGRNGDDLMVRDPATQQVSRVTLNNTTKIQSPSGIMKLEKKNQADAALIPGLIVKVYGAGGPQGELIAHRIVFRESSLRVANQISAGEVDLRARQQANARMTYAMSDTLADRATRAKVVGDSIRQAFKAVNSRVSDLDAYDVKDRATVKFATGRASLSEAARTELSDLVTRNQPLSGYAVQVAGYTDNTGNVALNQRLSERRADAVMAFLTQISSVPIRRINTPVGFGESNPVATNDTMDGRANNRRVEVKVLVNRGVAKP